MHDSLQQIIFYIVGGITLFSAFMVITQNNPVRCVLFLVLAFFTSSILWMLVEAEFLALVLVLVYVGAVMTLFLFVVMMLDIDIESMRTHFMRYLPFGLLLVALLVGLLYVAIPTGTFKSAVETVTASMAIITMSNTEMIGMELYTNYVFAFELAAVILLVAIIAAIAMVHRNPIRSKRQNITQQIMTRREDRVELLKMKAEK